jgi:hypothetical protein
MKKFTVLFAILALATASLACQVLSGGGDSSPSAPVQDMEGFPSDSSGSPGGSSAGGQSEFPMPNGAKNVISVAGSLNYQTNMSLEEVMAFYRDAYGKQGYIERPILTVVSDGVFSMVFDGHPSGQAVVIQGVDLGDGTMNVNIRLEDT